MVSMNTMTNEEDTRKKKMQKMRVNMKTWHKLEQAQNKTSVLISCEEQGRENLKEIRVLEGFLFLPFRRKECSFFLSFGLRLEWNVCLLPFCSLRQRINT